MSIQVWDICIINYPYEDKNGSKPRPVIVLPNNIGIKLTSHSPRNNCVGEYALQEWEKAGLKLPTTARLSKRCLINTKNILSKIGHLTDIDKENIILILKNMQIHI